MLASAQPSQAKIVYTPANLQLMNQQQVFLDLNHDGINDFSFLGMSTSRRSISTFYFRLTVSPAQQGNAIWGIESNEHASCAARLPAGRRIGPKKPFQSNRAVLFDWSGGPNGGTAFCPWAGRNGTAYLGFKFKIEGKTHFGWARVKTAFLNGQGARLTGYAYETIPNKAIVAGKTEGSGDGDERANPASRPSRAASCPTLGFLATGAPALSIWRREDPESIS